MVVAQEPLAADVIKHGPDAFSGLDALRLATSEGAKALHLDSEIGTIEPEVKVDIKSTLSGRVVDLPIRAGDRVEKGTPLIEIA